MIERAAIPEDIVVTPGGARARSLVHRIEPGHILDGTGGQHRMLRPNGEVAADFGYIRPHDDGQPLMPNNVTLPPPRPRLATSEAVQPPDLGSGWITYAYWNRGSDAISSFSTQWVVPAAPSSQDGQLIYLFNGIQNDTMILQPVLQWGSNGAFGGNYWCVASWYADGASGAAFHSDPVTVNVGDTLTGVMTLTGTSVDGYSYSCAFDGIAGSSHPVTNVPELWQAVQTLEAYYLTQASDYPADNRTNMAAIDIQTGSTTPDVTWTTVNNVTDTGQHCLIFNQGAAGHGEVDLWYREPGFWTVGAGTVAAGASWTSWFSWGGTGDVGPQLIQAEPLQPSGYLWTDEIAESLDSNGHLTYYATAANAGGGDVQFQWRGGGR